VDVSIGKVPWQSRTRATLTGVITLPNLGFDYCKTQLGTETSGDLFFLLTLYTFWDLTEALVQKLSTTIKW
jgi:hypothetical protein